MPTNMGKCITYYAAADHNQIVMGESLGLSLFVNVTPDDYPEIDPKILDVSKMTKTGLQVSVMSNLTHPSHVVLGQGIPILPRAYTAIQVSLTVVVDAGIKTVVDWSETECVPSNEVNYKLNEDVFLNTEPNCEVGASNFCIKQVCNCSYYGRLLNSNDSWKPCSLNTNFQYFSAVFNVMKYDPPYRVHGNVAHEGEKLNETLVLQCLGKAYRRCQRPCTLSDYTYTSTNLAIPDYQYQAMRQQFSLQNR
ncbi:uncharacterized protein [Procambarus clarkii]